MLVRAVVSVHAWNRNSILSRPRLDAAYYLEWARDIASGDLLGRAGTVDGDPFLLNPLYAYVLAPLVGAFGQSPVPVIVFQVLLGGGTAALTAAAALRFGGRAAAWVAGIAVALSLALVHLDAYVSVSGVAAFLVAGACWSMSPGDDAEPRRGHGPVATGIWLGLGALARPVTLFALPFAAWLHARRSPQRWRVAALTIAAFGACVVPSFLRNLVVSGEPVVFTAANGLNLHLGNNPLARRERAMTTEEFRFSPREMHDDAKYRVAWETRIEPTRTEVSDWYAARAREELVANPGESLAWYATKLRWFLSPEEPASSADLDYDLRVAPLLRLAFVRTWIVVALAAAGAVVALRRTDLLLGPGALVLGHAIAGAMVFPLSHYRSPALPALAVMAGAAVAAVLARLRETDLRPFALAGAVAGTTALVGSVEPQPKYQQATLLLNWAIADLVERDDVESAEARAEEARALRPDSLGVAVIFLDLAKAKGELQEARDRAAEISARQPWNPLWRVDLAWAELDLGRKDEAFAIVEEAVERFPWSQDLRARRDHIRAAAAQEQR